LAISIRKPARRDRDSKGKTEVRTRQTVQLSEKLVSAVEDRANLEVLPSAAFIRRAIKKFLSQGDTGASPVDVSRFAEERRSGSRGPLRQWPRGVSYVVDAEEADALSSLAAARTEASRAKTSVADLVREAIVLELDTPVFPQRALPRDEFGFTTSGAGDGGRSQRTMDDAWSATNE